MSADPLTADVDKIRRLIVAEGLTVREIVAENFRYHPHPKRWTFDNVVAEVYRQVYDGWQP